MGRYTKEATFKHWETELKVNKYLMIDYLNDSFDLALSEATRLYCQTRFIKHKSMVNNAYKKLIKLSKYHYDFTDKAQADLPDSDELKAIEAHPNYES